MNRAIPLKSLAPNELEIAGKAFDAAMARVLAVYPQERDLPALKQDVAANILAQVAAGETDPATISSYALQHLTESGRGAKLELPKKDGMQRTVRRSRALSGPR